MKKKLIVGLILTLTSTSAYSQVGIGTVTPSQSSLLDVFGNNKGILIPRVSLKNSTDNTTIAGGNVNSLLVYNTATIADIVPGYYYWQTNKWVQVASKDDIQASQKTTTLSNGTNTTVVGTPTGNVTDYKVTALQPWNIIGTTNSATTNTQSIYQNGKVGVGFASSDAITSMLEVNGAATNKASAANAAMTIDFSKSNLAYTTANVGAFTITNMKDGGTYTLAVKGTVSGTASFSQAGMTFRSVNNGATIASKQTVYTFIVMGADVYFWMNAGF